jgi:hypothetical protein
LKQYRSMTAVRWKSSRAQLVSSFKVHATSFKLEPQTFVADECGRAMTAYVLTEEHRRLFDSLAHQPLSYQQLMDRLKGIRGGQGTPFQVVRRLFEENFLEGYDRTGGLVKVQAALRFGGVGAEDDIS